MKVSLYLEFSCLPPLDDYALITVVPCLWTLVIFCLMIVASSFLVSCAYWLPWSMIGVLLNPFAAGLDAYNTDALLASTERTLFVSMRALFDRKTPPDPKEFLYEGSSPAPLSQRSASAFDERSSRRPEQSIRRLGRIHTRLPVKVTSIERPVEPSLSARRLKSAVEIRGRKTISGSFSRRRSTSDWERSSSDRSSS